MNKQKIEFNSKQELQDYIQEAITQAKRQTWKTQKQAYRQRKKQQITQCPSLKEYKTCSKCPYKHDPNCPKVPESVYGAKTQ